MSSEVNIVTAIGPHGVYTAAKHLFMGLMKMGYRVRIHDVHRPRRLGDLLYVCSLHPIKRWALKARRIYAYLPAEGHVVDEGVIRSLGNVEVCIATSNFSRTFISSVYPGEVKVVPLGIDLDFLSGDHSGRKPYDVAFVVSHQPNIHHFLYRKGFDIVKYVIGNTEFRIALNRHAYVHLSDVVDKGNTIVHFDTSEHTIRDIYRCSKCLLFPSRCEGFGLPVLESMACGTVPVYLNAPAHSEFAYGIPVPTGRAWSKVLKVNDDVYSFLYYEPKRLEHFVDALSYGIEHFHEYADRVRRQAERYSYMNMAREMADVLGI